MRQPLDVFFNTHLSSIHSSELLDRSNFFRLILETVFLSGYLQTVMLSIQDQQEAVTTNEHDRRCLEGAQAFLNGLQSRVQLQISNDPIDDLVSVFAPYFGSD